MTLQFLELTVGKCVRFYIRIFCEHVPALTPATPKHDETRTKLLPTRPLVPWLRALQSQP